MMYNPPHPGESITLLCLEPLGLSITQGAKALGITRTALSEIVNGKRGVSPTVAIKLAKAFGGSAQAWLNKQSCYDLWQTSQQYTADDVESLYKSEII